jgi:hypothetical protein
MFGNNRLSRILVPFCVLVFAAAFSIINAQDETLADIKYKEDYDRIQTIIKIGDVAKRADKLIAFYLEKRDMDSKLRDYADNVFARDLESIMKQGNNVALIGLSERILKVRPKFGEVYLFYGIALKRDKKIDEAMNAFARGSAIPNALSTRAKQQLDIAYRSVHGGSLVGEDKLIRDAMKNLK